MSGYDGSILIPEQLAEASTTILFQKLAEDMYASFKGALKCGNLESKVILSPAPVVSIDSIFLVKIKKCLSIIVCFAQLIVFCS